MPITHPRAFRAQFCFDYWGGVLLLLLLHLLLGFTLFLLHSTGYYSSLTLQSIRELTTGHNSVIKLLKAEMNFLIISVSDIFNLLREIEPLLELSK
ncbi:hypothetical protein VNO80_11283 [Phaseolus coccineus]|uniref:Uncharacterized protein n=1 Tax=Phaseolus coccineus TaxID=3886 RepID=A0AAN9NEX8_PHACN